MKDCVRTFFQDRKVTQGEKVLLAVSGGKDSMALLEVCCQLVEEGLPLQLAVAHFNHQSRGIESQGDEDFVRDWVAKRGAMPCFVGTANVPAEAKAKKEGFEETARRLRYQFLQQQGEQWGARYIATAHHCQDNLETFLFHLSRGTGLTGLSGIAPCRGGLIRPMLQVKPCEILAFLQKEHIPYREDSSNQEEVYRRNFIRGQIIPPLLSLNPQVLDHTSNTIRIIREENNFLHEMVVQQLPCTSQGDVVYCQRETFLALPSVLQERGLQYLVEQVSPSLRLTGGQRRGLFHLIRREVPNGESSLQGILFRRVYDRLEVSPLIESRPKAGMMPLPLGERISWGRWYLRLEEQPSPPVEGELRYMVPCQRAVAVRCRQEGDKLTLVGRPTKTVKKLCIEEKIPRHLREELPVLVDQENRPVAVAYLGVDQRSKTDESGWQWLLTPKIE